MLDFFAIWFDRLRDKLIGSFGIGAVHDLRVADAKLNIAISPHSSVWGCGRNLYGFILFGAEPRPGDIIQSETPENGPMELVALRVGTDSHWGQGASYGVARLSKWNDLVRFQAELRTIYPCDEVRRLEKIVWGLADQMGGRSLVRWHYLRSGAPQAHLEFQAEEHGLLVKVVAG